MAYLPGSFADRLSYYFRIMRVAALVICSDAQVGMMVSDIEACRIAWQLLWAKAVGMKICGNDGKGQVLGMRGMWIQGRAPAFVCRCALTDGQDRWPA